MRYHALRLRDRRHAGRLLARELRGLRTEDPLVLAIPRGGVPVAIEVAAELGAPLDVLCTRKLRHPFQPQMAIGAVAEGEILDIDEDTCGWLGIGPRALEAAIGAGRDALVDD